LDLTLKIKVNGTLAETIPNLESVSLRARLIFSAQIFCLIAANDAGGKTNANRRQYFRAMVGSFIYC